MLVRVLLVLVVTQWGLGECQKNGALTDCCMTTSMIKVKIENIVTYSLQDEPLCPVRAVRFLLFNQKTVCSRPNDPWAQRAMKALDARRRAPAPRIPWTLTRLMKRSKKGLRRVKMAARTSARTSAGRRAPV